MTKMIEHLQEGVSRGFRQSLCLILIAVGGVFGASTSSAQDNRQFSEEVSMKLDEIIRRGDAGGYQLALDMAQEEVARPDLGASERARLYQLMGKNLYELDRLTSAQEAFENAIQSGGLLPGDVENMKFVIAQLRFANGQFREAADGLEHLIEANPEKTSKYLEFLIQSLVQLGEYERALPWVEMWRETAGPTERKPYDFLNFIYNDQGLVEDQLRLIKEMINLWPEDQNLWDSWSSILANAGREAEAFEVHRMMYQAGLLIDERDILRVAQYYAFYDLPFQAAELLEREMETGRISINRNNLMETASFFRQAREPERAIPFLTSAATLSGEKDLSVELGVALAATGACKKSESAYETAIEKGYDPGKAMMLIGSCYVEQYQNIDQLSCNMTEAQRQVAPLTVAREAALKAFKAVPNASREGENAKKWTQFIVAEMQGEKRRCDTGWRDFPKELCFMKIKQAYDAAIFTGEFKLDDKSCEKHIVKYNAQYRVEFSRE